MNIALPAPFVELDPKAKDPRKDLERVIRDIQDNFQAMSLAWPAAVGVEATRTVRGCVSSAGSILIGSGFTAARASAGEYTLTWAPAFASGQVPVVVAMAAGDAGSFAVKQKNSTSPDNTVFQVSSFATATGTRTDCGFFFTAWGVGFA